MILPASNVWAAPTIAFPVQLRCYFRAANALVYAAPITIFRRAHCNAVNADSLAVHVLPQSIAHLARILPSYYSSDNACLSVLMERTKMELPSAKTVPHNANYAS